MDISFTRQEAIENHRKMWNWIADETEKRNRDCYKNEFLGKYEGGKYYDIKGSCFLCEYIKYLKHDSLVNRCTFCPLCWPLNTGFNFTCTSVSIYSLWCQEHDYEKRKELARKIANLPEKDITIFSDLYELIDYINTTDKIDDNFILFRKYIFLIDFDTLAMHKKLSEKFIDEFEEMFSWQTIVLYQKLSIPFIERHKNNIVKNDIFASDLYDDNELNEISCILETK